MRFEYDPSVEDHIERSAEIASELEDRAERILEGTVSNAIMAGSGGRYNPVVVEGAAPKLTVAAKGPFAHLDEWGGAKGPGPTAAMRNAAAAEGRFEEA